MKTPTLEELEKARTCESTYHDLIVWWAWNDPNGTWDSGLAFMQSEESDHAKYFADDEAWDPRGCVDEIVDRTIEYLGENCWFRTRPLTQENP